LSSEGDGPDGHEEVCLKVIRNTKDFFDQSLDEIKILELLRQTGMCHEKAIVEMKTFFYYREHLIIVTELLRQNLFEFGKFIVDHNEEPYFTLPRLAFITRQCLVALEFVHGLGLVHSDIKPENSKFIRGLKSVGLRRPVAHCAR
jgi:serine/threonine protein kinase